MPVDPIIAVRDVEASSSWYQKIFGWRSIHGGDAFDVLVSQDNQVALCLHRWGEDEHPTMMDPGTSSGNGLILYCRTHDLQGIRARLAALDHAVEHDLAINPNSRVEEFSVRDPDGYFWTVSAYHTFGG